MAQIIVMDGPGVGTTYELTSALNSIGRSNRCTIRLDSSNLSDQQAIIKKKGNICSIVSKAPGVLVNGQPVKQERKLIHGDMITLANIMLLYGEETSSQQMDVFAPPGSSHPSSEEDEALANLNPTIKATENPYTDTESAFARLGTTKHASKNMEVLLKVSNAIMAKLEVKELLLSLLDIIFEELPADRGTVFLRSPKANKLWPMASKRRDGQPVKGLMTSQTIIKEVLKKKQGVLTKNALEDKRFEMGMSIAAQQIHAAVCVPMVGKNNAIVGVIYIDSIRQDRCFNEDHLRLVTAIAMQTALAIENARLIQELSDKKRIEQELTIASDIQMELLPKSLPKVPGLEVHGLMIPAKEVGGDYYDFLTPEGQPDKMYMCIGDVSGKGVPAGLVMVMARCFFRPLIISCTDTKMILEEMNKFLVVDTRKDMFMSMLVLSWDPIQQKFQWTGAGHEHLLVYRSQTKKCEAIRAGGIVLGMMKKASKFFKQQELMLSHGDAIVLYTDGVTEAINPQQKMFELKRLVQLVEKFGELSAKEICIKILEEVKQFMNGAPQHDDITLVAIKKI